MSPYITPGVMITLSAIWPQVSLGDCGHRLFHRGERVRGAELHRLLALELHRVDGDDALGAGHRAPCTALMPMPPMPTTTTVSPALTSARLVAEPQPVATPQLTSATHSSGRSASTLMTEVSATHAYSANVPSLAISVTGLPLMKWRCVPSVIMPPTNVPAPASHRFWRPVLQ